MPEVIYIYADDPLVPLDDAARFWNEAVGDEIVQVVDDPEEATVIVTTLPEEHKKFQGRFRDKYGDKPDVILLTPDALSTGLGPNIQDKYSITVVAHEIGHALGLDDKFYSRGPNLLPGGIMAGRFRPSEKEATIVRKKAGYLTSRPPIKFYVQGAYPKVQAAVERAVELWNEEIGAEVAQIVPDGTRGAVPIRLANDFNKWYEGFAADEEAEFTEGEIRGTKAALLNEADLTLAHEMGHALGLYHPFPTSTAQNYIPATIQRVNRYITEPWAWRVAPVGLMGNEMNPNKPFYRGGGPSMGEIEWVRKHFGYRDRSRPYKQFLQARRTGTLTTSNNTPSETRSYAPTTSSAQTKKKPKMPAAKKRTLPDPRQR